MNRKKSLLSTAAFILLIFLAPLLRDAGVEIDLIGIVIVILGFAGPLSALFTLMVKLLAADGKDPAAMKQLKDGFIAEFMIWDELFEKENQGK